MRNGWAGHEDVPLPSACDRIAWQPRPERAGRTKPSREAAAQCKRRFCGLSLPGSPGHAQHAVQALREDDGRLAAVTLLLGLRGLAVQKGR